MEKTFLIYGANGFVGEAMAQLAVEQGYRPVLAGRNEEKIIMLARKLRLDYLVFSLDAIPADELKGIKVVLNCAGPFMYTCRLLVEFCIENGIHYLDISGEIPVFKAVSEYDIQARNKRVMLMPGAGFDVLPTDCLAVYLKNKLPGGIHLKLGFHSDGPAPLPPGTIKTMVELIPFGNQIRKDGQVINPGKGIKITVIDFGNGPQKAYRIPWGDVFTAFHSTGVPNIEVYAVFPKAIILQLQLIDRFRSLLSSPFMSGLLKRSAGKGSTEKQRAKTKMRVYGKLRDAEGHEVEARITGPEGGVIWTTLGALSIVKRILEGDFKAGYQTPGSAYGPDLVLDVDGVVREEVG